MATAPLQSMAAEHQLLGHPPSVWQQISLLPISKLVDSPDPSRSTLFLSQCQAKAQDFSQ